MYRESFWTVLIPIETLSLTSNDRKVAMPVMIERTTCETIRARDVSEAHCVLTDTQRARLGSVPTAFS